MDPQGRDQADRDRAHASLPVMCQHCAEPPCVDVCPTGASFKRADGIVLVDRHTLHRLPLLRDGLPVQGALLRARRDHEPEARRAARQGHGRELHAVRAPHRPGRQDDRVRRGLQRRPATARSLFGDLNDPQSEIARRVRELTSRRAARRSETRPRRALRGAVMQHVASTRAHHVTGDTLLARCSRSAASSPRSASPPRTTWSRAATS